MVTCDRVHQEHFLGIGHHLNATSSHATHRALHSINKPMFLVFILGDDHSKSCIYGDLLRVCGHHIAPNKVLLMGLWVAACLEGMNNQLFVTLYQQKKVAI